MKKADQLHKLSGPDLACRGRLQRWTNSTIERKKVLKEQNNTYLITFFSCSLFHGNILYLIRSLSISRSHFLSKPEILLVLEVIPYPD